MEFYFLLIFFIILLLLWDRNSYALEKCSKQSNHLLRIAITLVYLLCVLRDSSVGRDIPGYEQVYNWTKSIPWKNFNYVYFENGYILLMKICVKMNLSFQWFLAIVYAIILIPIYLFIKHYSCNKLLSMLVFICYIIFEFDLTGLRQAIAISILLLAFHSWLQGGKLRSIRYVLLTLLASTFHESALIALAFLIILTLFKSIELYSTIVCLGVIFSLFIREYLFEFLLKWFGHNTFSSNAGFHVGGNIIFMCIIALSGGYIYAFKKKYLLQVQHIGKILQYDTELFMLKAFMFGIVLAVFFGAATAARSYMFFSSTAMILIPNLCAQFDKKSRVLIELAVVVFFVVFFYFNTLRENNFDIVPYKFFWMN